MVDLAAARRFVQLHGRLLDRRRFAHLGDGEPAADVAAALGAYANSDGGYAGLLEPDVRTLSSQPIAVLTAFEVLHEIGRTAPEAALAWLQSTSNHDGGLPFHLPAADDAPQAPWMRPSAASSLHMTAAVTAAALRLGASGRWVDAATAYCRAAIAGRGDGLTAHETKYALDLLDAAGDAAGVAALARTLPPDGRLPVAGGVEGEVLAVLDLAPRPDSAVRRSLPPRLVADDLDRLAAGQREDGGWDVDWLVWAPSVGHEWRARQTVDAVAVLREHGRLRPG